MSPKQKNVLLVDAYNTFIRSWLIVPVTNDNGEHYGGVFGFLRSLKSAVDTFKPSEVVVVWDGPKSGLRRKELYPEYKANRALQRGSPRAFNFTSKEEQAENFSMQLNRIEEYLETLPIKVSRVPYVEADDVIALYVKALPEDCKAVIYSTDGDFKQLTSDRVSCFNPVVKKLTYHNDLRESMGIENPANLAIIKAVEGDKSDNISGLRGIGGKSMCTMFPEILENDLVEVDDILRKANEIGFGKDKKAKMVKKYQTIAENADTLRLNYRLMQLHDPDVPLTTKEFVRNLVASEPHKFQSLKMKMMFIEDKLEKTVRSYDEWARTFSSLQTH